MRIALISNSLPPEDPGGSQVYAAQLATTLAARHDVVVLTGARAARLQGVRVIALPALPPLPHEARQRRKAVWHVRDQWLPRVHLATSRELKRIAPDVVHTHEPQGLSAAVFSAIGGLGLPHVHTAHDLNLLCARISMTREDGRHCGGRCASCLVQRVVRGGLAGHCIDELIAPSDFIRDAHIRAGVVAERRAHTIRQGACGPARRRVASHSPRVGYIGTLAAHKGVRTLLHAFADAPQAWRLHIAGTGPLRAEVESCVSRDRRISYHGSVHGEDKSAFYDRLDVLVVPSEYAENAPLVVAEAAVRGIPVVVSDRGGLPETPGAHVFVAGDEEALRAALRSLLIRGPELAAASARLLGIRDQFLWSTHVERVEAVLHGVAGAGTRVLQPPPLKA